MTNAILIKIAVPENFSSEEKTTISKIIEEYFDPDLLLTWKRMRGTNKRK